MEKGYFTSVFTVNVTDFLGQFLPITNFWAKILLITEFYWLKILDLNLTD